MNNISNITFTFYIEPTTTTIPTMSTMSTMSNILPISPLSPISYLPRNTSKESMSYITNANFNLIHCNNLK